MLISFANAKGGAGKSTAAAGVAGELASRGYNVTCVDADPRLNLKRWYDNSVRNDLMPKNISMKTATKQSILQMIESKTDDEVMILDTQGDDAYLIEITLSAVDCVVTPLRPENQTIVGAGVIAEQRQRMPEDQRPPMLLFITQVVLMEKHSQTWSMMHEFADHFNIPIAQTMLWKRNCAMEMYSGAGTIQNYEVINDAGVAKVTDSIKKTRAEFKSLTDEIIETVHKSVEAA